MKLPNPFKQKPHERTTYQRLINEPMEVWVGGRKKSKPKRVMISEPSMMELGKHLTLFGSGVSEFLRANGPFLDSLLKADKIQLKREDFLKFASLPEAVRTIVADLVGESEDFVDNEMTAKQFTAVIDAYTQLIGWDYIRETFEQALQSWNAAGIAKDADVIPIKPSPSVEQPSE